LDKLALFALAVALALLAASPAHGWQCERATLAGVVSHVRDGDTIEVEGLPIRLNGLAAPEGDEPGGSAATTVPPRRKPPQPARRSAGATRCQATAARGVLAAIVPLPMNGCGLQSPRMSQDARSPPMA
jgi:hypothetical protein